MVELPGPTPNGHLAASVQKSATSRLTSLNPTCTMGIHGKAIGDHIRLHPGIHKQCQDTQGQLPVPTPSETFQRCDSGRRDSN